MTAPTLVGYACRCQTVRKPYGWRTETYRETRPNYQYHAVSVPVCDQDHAMTEVELCCACDAMGKTERTYEDFGLCLMHAQQAASSEKLIELIREITLLPGRMRT